MILSAELAMINASAQEGQKKMMGMAWGRARSESSWSFLSNKEGNHESRNRLKRQK